MAETDDHRDEIVRLIGLLKRYYAGQRVYVSGDLLVYYDQGNPNKFIVPDVFVVKESDPGNRKSYMIWAGGKPPNAIIEVSSRKTKRKDTVTKPALYRRLRVPEYFVFDLMDEYLEPPLQGHRLVEGEYRPIAPDAEGALVSEQLGLRLLPAKRRLLLDRLDTGERLLTAEEALEIEAAARRAEAAARRAAEAEVARLRRQLSRRNAN